ncbi:MAG: carboxypeptidase regulatory-like domain-containing protein [Planctomycetes bacterium]|nr:carboxypeptidase regulatory-like domain-containing protein [Planctomycetota bacterium]
MKHRTLLFVGLGFVVLILALTLSWTRRAAVERAEFSSVQVEDAVATQVAPTLAAPERASAVSGGRRSVSAVSSGALADQGATGTIIGTLRSTSPRDRPVRGALVRAEPAGDPVTESAPLQLDPDLNSDDPALNIDIEGIEWEAIGRADSLPDLLADSAANSREVPQRLAHSDEYRLERVAIGERLVIVEAEDFRPEWKKVMVRAGVETRVDFELVPLRPETLAIVLQDTAGRDLFEELSGAERVTARALRAVFVEHCPAIGQDLPLAPQFLNHKVRAAHDVGPGLWLVGEFERRESACVAVVLGRRVLNAAPIAVGQTAVTLRIAAEELREWRGAFQFRITDEHGAALPSVAIKLTTSVAEERYLRTDSEGRVTAADLTVGETQVTLTLAGYTDRQLSLDVEQGRTTNIELVLERPATR